ncbi:MAG TPA: hypothetical protein VF516_21130 [Kofleriaceae bacterium]
MTRLSRFALRRLLSRIIGQPGPRDAMLRFVYYTEEFVERYDIQPILPHLGEAERDAMLRHFRDESAHARALRAYCRGHGLAIERSPAEDALIRRSDEGYAQYLRHLDPATHRFTPEDMYAYYCHVHVQEELANDLYSAVADTLEQHREHPKLVKILRAFAKSEVKHQDYAGEFMKSYEARLGARHCRRVLRRTRIDSARTGLKFFRDFLRLLVSEHQFQPGALAVVL